MGLSMGSNPPGQEPAPRYKLALASRKRAVGGGQRLTISPRAGGLRSEVRRQRPMGSEEVVLRRSPGARARETLAVRAARIRARRQGRCSGIFGCGRAFERLRLAFVEAIGLRHGKLGTLAEDGVEEVEALRAEDRRVARHENQHVARLDDQIGGVFFGRAQPHDLVGGEERPADLMVAFGDLGEHGAEALARLR